MARTTRPGDAHGPHRPAHRAWPSRFLVLLLKMFHQRVAEVVGEVTVDAVNVIGAVLRIVVLDQERRALDEVMMRLTGLEAAGPLEMDLLHTRPLDAHPILELDLASPRWASEPEA